MLFIKTFKGYEDKVGELDATVNGWLQKHQKGIEAADFKIVLSHEPDGRSRSGDLICAVIYRATVPVADQ